MAHVSLRTALLLASVLTTSVVYSTAYTWVGGSSGEWTQSGNWSSSGGTFPQTSSDTAAFSLPGSTISVTIASPISLKTLTATNTSTGGPSLFLSGSTITLSGGMTISGSAGNVQLTIPPLSISGANTFSFVGGHGGDFIFSSPISETPVGSGATMTFTGTGVVIYDASSNNTNTGTTTITNASMGLNTNDGIIAIPGNFTVNTGAVVNTIGSNVIATTSNIKVNAGTLNLQNYSSSPTFASLIFRNNATNSWPNLPLIFTNATPLTVGGATL